MICFCQIGEPLFSLYVHKLQEEKFWLPTQSLNPLTSHFTFQNAGVSIGFSAPGAKLADD